METQTEIFADRMAWLKKRGRTRKKWLGLTLLFVAFFAPLLWLGDQEDKQQFQEAAQYQSDCSKPTATSPNCQLLTMQIYEHRKEGFLDPDEDAHLWLGLQSKSEQRFEVDTFGPQWDRLHVGDSVTAVIWNGEVEEVRDSGGTERMKTNPMRKAKDRRLTSAGLKILTLICFCLVLIAFTAADKLHERRWVLKTSAAQLETETQ